MEAPMITRSGLMKAVLDRPNDPLVAALARTADEWREIALRMERRLVTAHSALSALGEWTTEASTLEDRLGAVERP